VGVKCSPIVIASTACGARQSRLPSVISTYSSVIPALFSVIPAIFLCHSRGSLCYSRENGNPSSPSLRDLHTKSWQFYITIPHHRKLIILISFFFSILFTFLFCFYSILSLVFLFFFFLGYILDTIYSILFLCCFSIYST